MKQAEKANEWHLVEEEFQITLWSYKNAICTIVDNRNNKRKNHSRGKCGPDYTSVYSSEDFHLPPDRPAGRPIEVTYKYDDNQRMHCTFKDVESGRYLEMDIDTKTEFFFKQQGRKTKGDVLGWFCGWIRKEWSKKMEILIAIIIGLWIYKSFTNAEKRKFVINCSETQEQIDDAESASYQKIVY